MGNITHEEIAIEDFHRKMYGKTSDGFPVENGMIESGAIQDKRERGWGIHEDDEEPQEEHYNLFADPDYLFQKAIELSREQWERIKKMKEGLEDDI